MYHITNKTRKVARTVLRTSHTTQDMKDLTVLNTTSQTTRDKQDLTVLSTT